MLIIVDVIGFGESFFEIETRIDPVTFERARINVSQCWGAPGTSRGKRDIFCSTLNRSFIQCVVQIREH